MSAGSNAARRWTAFLAVALAFAPAAGATPFINELHYDDDGTDTGERVEIVAPSGTSLSGWTVQLYNGNGGARYATVALSGTTADQCGGHGTVVASVAGIQNGSPDGIALVDAGGAVVQFLSYEGSFTASDGPAMGMASTAIGSSEGSSTPAGQSLQLAGTGSQYGDFGWQPPAAESFGACNAGQSFEGGGGGGGSQLANGVPVSGLAASTGDSLAYTLEVPAGATDLSIAINGGSGDADLYLRHGSAPTLSSYDCRPYLSGNDETCSVASPAAGTWHVMVRAYTSYGGVTLTGSYTAPGGGGDPEPDTLANGVPVTGLAASSGDSLAYTLEVPAGASDLAFAISGGSGDADLYVRHGSAPTTSSYDCRPWLNGNNETCSFAAPAAGTWHVMVRAYTTFSGAQLLASYSTGGGGGDPGGYYGSADPSSAASLRASLHAIIDDHTRFPYSASSTDTWDVLEFADEDPLDPARVLDIYRNASYAKAGGGNTQYNREHTWPNSYGFPDDGPSNYAYTDLHMLMISDIGYNSDRGNKPFGDCNASCTERPTLAHAGQGGGSGSFPGNSNWTDGTIWQVWSRLKGNVARAMFYMDLRYEGGSHGVTGASEPDLRLTDTLSLVTTTGSNAAVAYMGRLSTLLGWHAEDPVTEAERLRNDAIASYQGNRNPFVDHPEWVACVYQGACP